MNSILDDAIALLVVSGTTTLPYFDGTMPFGSTNFLNNSVRLTSLHDGLVRFFGQCGILTCTDGSISSYSGGSSCSYLYNIHHPMGITKAAFDDFNQAVIDAMNANFVPFTDNSTVKALLDSTEPCIVSNETLCDKYSRILNINNHLLMETIVNATINGLVTSPITLIYFNGEQPKGSTDFLVSGSFTELNALRSGLVSFFGDALGCLDGTIASYSGRPLNLIHQFMGVRNNVFDEFNRILLDVTSTSGVTDTDNALIAAALESYRPEIVFPYYQRDYTPYRLTGNQIAPIVVCAVFAALLFVGICVGFTFLEKKYIPKFKGKPW